MDAPCCSELAAHVFFFFPERFPVLDQGVQEHLKDAVAGTLKLKRLLSALDARGQGTLLLITRSY